MICCFCTVLAKARLTRDIYDLRLQSRVIAQAAKPGQFVHIRCGNLPLRRPISICDTDQSEGSFRIVFQAKGEGTNWLANVPEGMRLDILGPLGRGYELGDLCRRAVFVGGGIGVPPLVAASRPFGGRASVLLGFRSVNDSILTEDFARYGGRVQVATDDGSLGHHGLVTDLLIDRLNTGACDAVFACGPRAMLRATAQEARKRGIPCQVSLEEHMACGVGACLGCACRIRENGEIKMRHVCKDGPVFDAETVVW